MSLLKSAPSDGCDYLFTGSRDSTLKRWALVDDIPSFSANFESHVDWVIFIYLKIFSFPFVFNIFGFCINYVCNLQVNDAVLVSDNVLVSCSSDTTIKVCRFLVVICCNLSLLY